MQSNSGNTHIRVFARGCAGGGVELPAVSWFGKWCPEVERWPGFQKRVTQRGFVPTRSCRTVRVPQEDWTHMGRKSRKYLHWYGGGHTHLERGAVHI